MSVVNRMLQDIDRRRDATAGEVSDVFEGTESVEPPPSQPEAKRKSFGPAWRWLTALLVIGVAVWRFWPVETHEPPPVAAKPAASPVPAVASVAAASPAMPPAEPVPPVAATVAELAPAPSPHVAPTVETPAAATEPKPAKRHAKNTPVSPEKLKLSMKLSVLNSETPLAPAVPVPIQAAPAAVAPATVGRDIVTITNAPSRPAGAEETLRVARALWADGAKATALATLRDALAAAESARNARGIAPLAREIARLEIADNRSQSALDLLTRLENYLGEDAEAWALRGNAEQRLAQHAEAAESYLAALRLKPTEAKWMLGAAISLAANGKTDEARLWAERANERGAISPTIANYLRQLGVAVR